MQSAKKQILRKTTFGCWLPQHEDITILCSHSNLGKTVFVILLHDLLNAIKEKALCGWLAT